MNKMTKQQLSKLIREAMASETEPVPGLYRDPKRRKSLADTSVNTKRERGLERKTRREPGLERKTLGEPTLSASEKPWVTHDESGATGTSRLGPPTAKLPFRIDIQSNFIWMSLDGLEKMPKTMCTK